MLNTIYTDSILERYEDLDTVKGIMAELDDNGRTADSFTDDEAYTFAQNEIDGDWDFLMEQAEWADKENPGYYVVKADLGLWDGHHAGGRIFNSLREAIRQMAGDMDSVAIYEDDRGNAEIKCGHHDGTNVYQIRRLNKKGAYAYEHSDVFESRRSKVERFFKPVYSNNAHLMKLLQW